MRSILFGLLLPLAFVPATPAAAAPQRAGSAVPVPGAPRDPAVSSHGRLAVSIDGHIWVGPGRLPSRGAGRAPDVWVQVTSGSHSDVEPAWSPDGRSLVFASDRAGGWDLWSVQVDTGRAAGGLAAPRRLTTDPAAEREPAVAGNGDIVFVRGTGPTAHLWVREPDGHERALTHGPGAQRFPAVSPAGAKVAYVSVRLEGTELREVGLDGRGDRPLLSGYAALRPAWSPDGRRLVFASQQRHPGTWITDVSGRYVNLLSATPAAAAWSPDGHTLVLAALPEPAPAFNGDPDRLGDRAARNLFPHSRGLWTLPAPTPPDTGRTALAVRGRVDRRAHNAEVFDRVWRRVNALYYTDHPGIPHRTPAELRQRQAEWSRLRDRYRPLALAAPDDSALGAVLHRMILQRPPLREPAEGRAAVASANAVATAAGLQILREGGNVVDAAVAVSFALGVVEPEASGIGGYGQMLIYQSGMRQPELLEFMTRTPQDASLSNGELLRHGRYPDDGPVLTQVPGTLAGMYRAWREHGHLPWKQLVQPAIHAAEHGFEVSDGLATTLSRERDHFLKYAGSRALFFPGGQPLQAGDTLRNPDLARVLRAIADSGADVFYHGWVGRRMVQDLRAHGNPIRMLDVERYYAARRQPVSGTYRGYTVYSSAPPSAGGASLVAKLNMLENFHAMRPYTDDAATLHAMIEAWKLAPSSRGRIADPGLWPVDVAAVTSKDSARARWRCFDPDHASPDDLFDHGTPACMSGTADSRQPARGPGAPGPAASRAAAYTAATATAAGAGRGHVAPADGGDEITPERCAERDGGECTLTGTTAFVVADGQGNVVSVTQTLGTWGGTFYVSPGLGFTYNDKLTSYALDPQAYGARLPNSRHGSTISPTIVMRGSGAARTPIFAFGTAGNAWITAGVYEEMVGLADFGMTPTRALELPRFLLTRRIGDDGRRHDVIQIEDGIAPTVIRRLQAMGHHFQFVSLKGELREGYGAALMIRDGHVIAGADPRRNGAAGAIR